MGLLLVYLSIVLPLLQDCMHVSLLNLRFVSCFSFCNLAYSLFLYKIISVILTKGRISPQLWLY